MPFDESAAPDRSVDDVLAALAAELSRESADVTALPAVEAKTARELSLGEFNDLYFRPWREARLAAKTIAESTIETERRHVGRYSAWDREQQPADWPAGVPWNGLPLRYVSAGWLIRFLRDARDDWANATVVSCLTSLRTVLSYARRLGVIEQTPKLGRLKRILGFDDADDPIATVYTDGELARLYAAFDDVIAGQVEAGTFAKGPRQTLGKRAAATARELKTALVVGINAGPRPGDLLRFEFERHVKLDRDPPELVFRARKTRKQHRVPLAPVTVDHLRRLRECQGRGRLFPHLMQPTDKALRDSTAYRRSVAAWRQAMRSIGLDDTKYAKPWHSLRKSCTTRFNAHGIARGLGSVGKLITHGRDSDVASQSYDNPLPTMAKAVATIGWPAAFNAPFRETSAFVASIARVFDDDQPVRSADFEWGVNWFRYRGGDVVRFRNRGNARLLRLLQVLVQARRPLAVVDIRNLVFIDSPEICDKTIHSHLSNLRRLLTTRFDLERWDPIPFRNRGYVLRFPSP